jgi:hypothetical protein
VRSKEDMFSKEGGHESQENKNFVIFRSSYFSAVGGHTVQIHTVRIILYSPYSRAYLARKSRWIWAWFSRQISDLCSLFLVNTE